MVEKHQSFDTPEKLEASQAPSHSHAGSRNLKLGIRFCHALLAIGLVYSFHSWLYDRFAGKEHNANIYPLWDFPALDDHQWGGKDDILNGHRAEQIFLQVPDEQSAIAASRIYAGLPHVAGSAQDLVTAKYVVSHFQESFKLDPPSKEAIYSAGSDESRSATLDIPHTKEPRTWIDTYYPVLNTPLGRSLQILEKDGSVAWTAELEEDGDPLDEDAANARIAVPTFHGLSKGGDVTGEIFYANYGQPNDYDEVERSGINITGKIALVRYGAIFRGLKIKFAEERGAVGVLIYSDPRDDGSVTVENGYIPYPHGPARNPTAVQRGSVQYLSLYPGDPTTPGYPAYENSTRVDGTNIPHVPSLPISWSNAKVLLDEIAKDGQGRAIRLVNQVDDKVTPIWNSMAVIPGHIGSEVVVLGCHRDAWVLGAADPSSGTTSVHEVIRGLGALYQRGWRPLRTILLASWDAEEYGLVGSTEWGEDFAEWIGEHVVAYVNMDSSVSGSRFGASASPSLAHLLRQAAESLPHPTRNGSSLWDATGDKGSLTGPADPAVVAMAEAEEQAIQQGLGISPLGSGSDFTVFLQRIGVASSNCGFGSTLSDPVYHYHSIYDSQRFQELYADPGFHRHVAISKLLGLVVLRLADSLVLPLNTTHYALELGAYLDRVEEVAGESHFKVDFASVRRAIKDLEKASVKLDKEKFKAEKHLRRVLERWQRHHGGRFRHHVHDSNGGTTHYCGSRWKRMSRWIKSMFGAASEGKLGFSEVLPHSRTVDDSPSLRDYPRHRHHHSHQPHPPPHKLIKAVKRVQAVNKKLRLFERGFISKKGLTGREWYKHLGVAPGRYLGYGATTLPGLTEAFTLDRDITQAEREAKRLTKAVKRLAKSIAVKRG